MTAYPTDRPLSSLPFDMKALERDVQEMERTLELLRRRDEAIAALTARGVEYTVDTLNPADLFALVAKRRRVSVEEIRSRSKLKHHVHARHEVFYVLSIQVKPDGSKRYSLSQIGRRVALINAPAFDHTTVLNGCRAHAKRIAAAASGGRVVYSRRGARPAVRRVPPRTEAAMVCMLPANETCPGCGAAAGAPCLDGARRAAILREAGL
jgi:hypothetical protein